MSAALERLKADLTSTVAVLALIFGASMVTVATITTLPLLAVLFGLLLVWVARRIGAENRSSMVPLIYLIYGVVLVGTGLYATIFQQFVH